MDMDSPEVEEYWRKKIADELVNVYHWHPQDQFITWIRGGQVDE